MCSFYSCYAIYSTHLQPYNVTKITKKNYKQQQKSNFSFFSLIKQNIVLNKFVVSNNNYEEKMKKKKMKKLEKDTESLQMWAGSSTNTQKNVS